MKNQWQVNRSPCYDFGQGALVAVNAVGGSTVGTSGSFRAVPFELDGGFGGLGLSLRGPESPCQIATTLHARQDENTTIAIVATDLPLTKADAHRLSIAAHDGLARAIWPAHTPMDGDLGLPFQRAAPANPFPGDNCLNREPSRQRP